jgi:uncharacterized protein (TIGR03083 family)
VARLHQYYGSPGVPLRIGGDPHDAVAAWHTQRNRMHSWLAALPDDRWDGPTRCQGWDTTLLVRHLSSATQFLGYTLAEASEGNATMLLEGMDTRTTVASAAEMLGDRSPEEAREFLAAMDRQVKAALIKLGDDGLQATAEAPPGHLAVHLAMRHFLFDSWVHEYDLMLPPGEQPVVDTLETAVVVGYLIGLASLAHDSPCALELRIDDPDLRIGVDVVDGVVTIAEGDGPSGAAVIEGRAVDVVDRMTGRPAGTVGGDDAGLEILDALASVLAT